MLMPQAGATFTKRGPTPRKNPAAPSECQMRRMRDHVLSGDGEDDDEEEVGTGDSDDENDEDADGRVDS